MIKALTTGKDQLASDINAAHAEFLESAKKSAEYGFRVGELLTIAKAKIGHGKWADWIAENCDFEHRTANTYMQLFKKRDAIGANSQHAANLSIRAALACIEEPEETECEEQPAAEVIEMGREICCVSDLSELAATGQKFGTIYADPPWNYSNQSTRAATDNHYETMTVADIAAMPIKGLAADKAHLHCWTTNAFLFETKAIIEAWGFEYKGLHVWCKSQLGIGNYWRVSHEILLLGVRGGLTAASRSETSWTVAGREGHSVKPEIFREKIQKLSPGPYLELFARRAAPGWVSWGNEIEKDLFTASMEASNA